MDPVTATARLKSFVRAGMLRTQRSLQKAVRKNTTVPVHEARKSIKRLRAALRLLARLAEPSAVEAVVDPLRKAAHRLGPLRDVLVLRQTSRSLLQRGEKPLPAAAAPEAAPLLREARLQLRQARTASRRLLKLKFDPAGVREGLQDLCRRARRALRVARKKPSDENLHAWRRRAKDLFYNLELLRAPKEHVDAVRKLTSQLGDDHDLAFFAGHYSSAAGRDAHRPLFKRAKKKRAKLQKKAFQLGESLFADRPKKLARMLMK